MAPEKSAIFYIPTFSTVNRQSFTLRSFPLIFRQHESIHLQILFHPATIQTNRRHPIFLTIPARLHDHLVSRFLVNHHVQHVCRVRHHRPTTLCLLGNCYDILLLIQRHGQRPILQAPLSTHDFLIINRGIILLVNRNGLHIRFHEGVIKRTSRLSSRETEFCRRSKIQRNLL